MMNKQDDLKLDNSSAVDDLASSSHEWPEGDEVTHLREKHYNATLIDRIRIHDDLARFRIRPDNPIPSFQAGQYVALGLGNWERRLPETQKEQLRPSRIRKVVRRAYSISCPLIDIDGTANTHSSPPAENDCTPDKRDVLAVNSIDFLEFYVTLVREAGEPGQKPPALTPRLFASE